MEIFHVCLRARPFELMQRIACWTPFSPLLSEYSLQMGPFSTDSSLKIVGDSILWAFLVSLSSSPSDEQKGLFLGFSTTVNVLPCWARAHTYKLSNETA